MAGEMHRPKGTGPAIESPLSPDLSEVSLHSGASAQRNAVIAEASRKTEALVDRIPFINQLSSPERMQYSPSRGDAKLAREQFTALLQELGGDPHSLHALKSAFQARTQFSLERFGAGLFDNGSLGQTRVLALLDGNIPRADAARLRDLQEGWTSGADQDEMLGILRNSSEPQALVSEYMRLAPKDSFYEEMISNTDGKQEEQMKVLLSEKFPFLPELEWRIAPAGTESSTGVRDFQASVTDALQAKVDRFGEILSSGGKVVGEQAEEVEQMIRSTPEKLQQAFAEGYQEISNRNVRDIPILRETLSQLDAVLTQGKTFFQRLFSR